MGAFFMRILLDWVRCIPDFILDDGEGPLGFNGFAESGGVVAKLWRCGRGLSGWMMHVRRHRQRIGGTILISGRLGNGEAEMVMGSLGCGIRCLAPWVGLMPRAWCGMSLVWPSLWIFNTVLEYDITSILVPHSTVLEYSTGAAAMPSEGGFR